MTEWYVRYYGVYKTSPSPGTVHRRILEGKGEKRKEFDTKIEGKEPNCGRKLWYLESRMF